MSRVTGSPSVVWLVYGEPERDCAHHECIRDGDVGWCEDEQFDDDVPYFKVGSQILGARVEGSSVVLSLKGGNEAAREICGQLVALIEKRRG